MTAPILLQMVLAIVFAALGVLGFVVSIHPPKTAMLRRTYLCVFVGLTALGVTLVSWQSILAERSQAENNKTSAELQRQVSALYGTQIVAMRPTEQTVKELEHRVYLARRDLRFGDRSSLELQTRLLAAEILLFVAERSMTAPRIEPLEVSEGASTLVDKMTRLPHTEPLTDREKLGEAHRTNQAIPMGPVGGADMTADEVRWLQRNGHAIDYYAETLRLFSKRFALRVGLTLHNLKKAGVVDSWIVDAGLNEYQTNDRGMAELARRLADAAEKLRAKDVR